MKKLKTVSSLCLLACFQHAFAAISEEEAQQLGTTLTPIGAEMAGNAEGTIPAWNPVVDLKSSDSVYITNPLKEEDPVFSITAGNMAEYADRLTDGTKKLFERKPLFRMDVYKTQRTVTNPEFIYKNTKVNASNTELVNDGLTLKNWKAGVPFPIPQNGSELIWNHLVRYLGTHSEATSTVFYVGPSGNAVESSTQFLSYTSPAYLQDEGEYSDDKDWLLFRANFIAPARRAGEMTLVHDPADFSNNKGRKAWQYLAGQRRVKRAPAVGFDTPAPATSGNSTYDDISIFNGSPERFDWKLIGKKELYIPYNNWKLTNLEDKSQLMTPETVNPNLIRWELHRCWVVEATIKEDQRHIYSKRRYYFDEDSWTAVAGDLYDNRNVFWRSNFSFFAHDYMSKSLAQSAGSVMYDFNSNRYSVSMPKPYSVTSMKDAKNSKYYTSQGLARGGIR